MMNPIYQAEEALHVALVIEAELLQEGLCKLNRAARKGAASRDQIRHGLAATT
jgi:hypothetical protein